jgi:hypothetical protein
MRPYAVPRLTAMQHARSRMAFVRTNIHKVSFMRNDARAYMAAACTNIHITFSIYAINIEQDFQEAVKRVEGALSRVEMSMASSAEIIISAAKKRLSEHEVCMYA